MPAADFHRLDPPPADPPPAAAPPVEPSLDQTLQALADPTRRALLDRLARGPARVTTLAEPFDISLNSVSKHLRVLERAGLVRRRRRGREHILALDPQPLDEAARWIAEHRARWTARLDTLEAILRAEDEAAAGPAAGRSPQTEKGSQTP